MKKRRWKKMTALSLLFIFFSSNHIPAEPLPQDNPDETQEENEIETEEEQEEIAIQETVSEDTDLKNFVSSFLGSAPAKL